MTPRQITPEGKALLKLIEQGKSEGFDSCVRPINLAQIGSKSNILPGVTAWHWNLLGVLEKWQGTSSLPLYKAMCVISYPSDNFSWSYQSETLKLEPKSLVFHPVWPWIWQMTSKNNRAHLWYFKFLHHFVAIGEFKLELQSENAHFGYKFTLFCRRWPRNLEGGLKKIGYLSYATSSFVHHFVAIGEFKLELQPGNAQFESKSSIFWAVWP